MTEPQDDTIHTAADLKRALEGTGVEILGEIPRLDELKVPDPSLWEKLRIMLELRKRKK